MVYRKSEISNAAINKGFPHQLAVKALEAPEQYERHVHLMMVIDEQDWQVAPRCFSVVYEGDWWNVYCFADKSHAEMFKALFGGVWTQSSERGSGSNWARWTPRQPIQTS